MVDKIVLLSLDTLRSDGLASDPSPLWPGKYPRLRRGRSTSLLDELIGRSAYFPHCISAAPYTSASHASFFTGLWPLHHGVFEIFNRRLARDTIFSAGKKLGYETVLKVDFPVILGRHLGFDRDIDRYLVEEDEVFLDYVEAADRVVACAHFGGIHIPYGFHNLRFGGPTYRQRVKELEDEIGAPYEPPGDQLVETYRDPADLDLLHRYKRVVQHYYAGGDYDKLFGLYLEGIDHFLHERFEAFLARLLDICRRSNALLVVFADHGEEYDADSYGHHNSLSEGVLRVPLIIHAPDVRPAVHDTRIRSIDLVPTLLDRLGHPGLLGPLDGESLHGSVWGDAGYPARMCIAQAYTSDTAEFVAHQAQMLRHGMHEATLRHVLYKEAVYLGAHKLVRQNYEYSEAGGIYGLRESPRPDRLFEQDADGRWQATRDTVPAGALLQALERYNGSAGTACDSIRVESSVRRSLQDMGYRI
ncbi:MAG: sulfatase-like hydrolase/transferase [Burkholderiales bacterium]|nr:sulfatase-like hydrolase/transferase [Burkholderiales bacterium]